MTLTQFDSQGIDVVFDALEVGRVRPLTRETYRPRAWTPLYDAVGRTLALTEGRLRESGWKGVVLAVVITDGCENASQEWDRARVFGRIKELEAAGWGFMYLGAHPDAYADAAALGIHAGATARWAQSAAGVAEMGRNLGAATKRWRNREAGLSELITAEERARMKEPAR